VIEDSFTDGRPAWDAVPNTLLVPGEDVHVYESMKLRLLNGSHSALSYVSYLVRGE
jgi:fructuronate reductase